MNFQRLVAKQDVVYAEFEAATNNLNEFRVDPCIPNPSAGYIVALRYSDAILQRFSQFTASLHHIVPALPFDAENGHTTITVYEKQALASFEPNPSTLEALCRTVAQIDRQMWQQVKVDFQHWYFNAETIIVAGLPNDWFWEVVQQVQATGLQQGLDLRLPWGAHMTAGRFTQRCGANTVESLRQRLLSAPILGISVPTALHVGYYTSSEAGFNLHTVQAFQ